MQKDKNPAMQKEAEDKVGALEEQYEVHARHAEKASKETADHSQKLAAQEGTAVIPRAVKISFELFVTYCVDVPLY